MRGLNVVRWGLASLIVATVAGIAVGQEKPTPKPTTQMVAMRDGVKLATDVYLPGDTADTSSPITVHAGTGSLQTNYISPSGNHAGAPTTSRAIARLACSR